MNRCSRHPDVETDYFCEKDKVYMCDKCLGCRNEKLYCKHRRACAIWFETHEEKRIPASGAT